MARRSSISFMLACWFLAGVVIAVLGAGHALAEKRVALVIGNSGYVNVPKLLNPRNDAHDVSEKLKALDFEVVTGFDIGVNGWNATMREFERKAVNADVAMFFYAGHALQHRGTNYLMSVDAVLKDETDLNYDMKSLNEIRELLDRSNIRVKIIILDACRDNPLANQFTRTVMASSRNYVATRGLARIDKPEGSIVVYATAAGKTADDGKATRNSPFTTAFLRRLDEPGLEITDLFRRVMNDVRTNTNGRQLPEISFDLPDFFYLNRAETDAVAWQRADDSDDPERVREFIRRYPKSRHVRDAERWLVVYEQRQRDQLDLERRKLAAAEEVKRKAAEEADRARQEAIRRAEQQKRDEEERRAAEKKALEDEQRRATEAKKAREDEARRAEQARKEEEARIAAEKKLRDDEARRAAEARRIEDARIAAEKKAQEEAARRQAEADRKAAQDRIASEKKAREDEARRAAEVKKIEEARIAAEKKAQEDAARRAAEAKKLDDARIAAENKAKDDAARRQAEADRKAEQDRIAAAKQLREDEVRRAAEAKKIEEARIAAEMKAQEDATRRQVEADRKAAQDRIAAEKKARDDEARRAAEAKKTEDARIAAEKKAQEEAARRQAEAEKKLQQDRAIAESRARAEEERVKAAARKAEAEQQQLALQERRNALRVAGVMALDKCVAASASRPAAGSAKDAESKMAPVVRIQVQQMLADRGLFSGKADGTFSTATRTAIGNFQQSIGAPKTGYLTSCELEALSTSRE